MAITVQVKGDKRVSRVLLNLGKEMNKNIGMVNKRFMESVYRGARIRAPKNTGHLAKSIELRRGRKKGNWVLGVGAKYGIYVELGYKPHLVNTSAQVKDGTGKTIADVYPGLPEGVTILVTRPRKKHFIRDSFQSAIPKLPTMMNKAVGRAVKKWE